MMSNEKKAQKAEYVKNVCVSLYAIIRLSTGNDITCWTQLFPRVEPVPSP